MTTRTVITRTCDSCSEPIAEGEKYLNAGKYGVDLHMRCVTTMPAPILIRILDLDVKIMTDDDWATATKGPSYFRNFA